MACASVQRNGSGSEKPLSGLWGIGATVAGGGRCGLILPLPRRVMLNRWFQVVSNGRWMANWWLIMDDNDGWLIVNWRLTWWRIMDDSNEGCVMVEAWLIHDYWAKTRLILYEKLGGFLLASKVLGLGGYISQQWLGVHYPTIDSIRPATWITAATAMLRPGLWIIGCLRRKRRPHDAWCFLWIETCQNPCARCSVVFSHALNYD